MNEETILFLCTTVMELSTLVCAYLALRLLRKNRWLRLGLIIVPLMLNALFYIVFRSTPFFYLGVLLLLCIPFVWPRKSS